MRTKPVLVAAVLAAAILLAACGSSGSDSSSDPGSGSGDKTTTTQEEPGDGSVTMPVKAVEIPADFPKAFEPPKGVTVTEATTVGEEGTSFYVAGTVDDPEAAFDAFKTQVADAGYEILADDFTPSDQGGYGGFSARGTDYTAAIAFGPDPTGSFSTLSINLAPAP